MGFHACEYCSRRPQPGSRFDRFSSGDVTMVFDSGRGWEMPDMILHYVADHAWLPPTEFVKDVMGSTLVAGRRDQSKGAVRPVRIAYLSGTFPTGSVPDGFIERLEGLMKEADAMGGRVQYL